MRDVIARGGTTLEERGIAITDKIDWVGMVFLRGNDTQAANNEVRAVFKKTIFRCPAESRTSPKASKRRCSSRITTAESRSQRAASSQSGTQSWPSTASTASTAPSTQLHNIIGKDAVLNPRTLREQPEEAPILGTTKIVVTMSIKGATDEELGEGMPEFTIDDITQEEM